MFSGLSLIPVVVFFVILAGFFSGAETGIYRLSRLRLRLGIEKKQLAYIVLGRAMHDSPSLLLSTLIGTSLAHYFATSIVTFMLLNSVQAEHTSELFATFITAPTLFVFSELIPKNIFFYRADTLMPALGAALYTFQKLLTLCGIIPLLKFVIRAFARLAGTPTSSKTVISDVREHHIEAILQETREEGFLSRVQTDIINRIMAVPNMRLRSVMIPVSKVRMVAQDSDAAALLDVLKKHSFTRLPVYEGAPANIVGFVNIYEVLSAPEPVADLRNCIKTIRRLSADATVIDAINTMQRERQKIILVTRGGHPAGERPLGIVTMKDLVEEILGELVEW
jgi:CBS domain containing-hemolysin-like protein